MRPASFSGDITMIDMRLTAAELTQLNRGKRLRKKRHRSALPRAPGPTILMAKTAYEHGMRALARRPPEAGALLIGPAGHRSVTHVIPDETGHATAASFTWDHRALNATLAQYTALGLDAKGFLHTHPGHCRRLSEGDLEFVRRVVLVPGNAVD